MSPIEQLAPHWFAAWQAMLAVAPFLCVLIGAEVVFAGRALRWKNIAFNLALAPFLLTAGFALHAMASEWTSPWISGGSLGQSLELFSLPMALLVFLYLAVFDLLYYGFHRLQHAVPWLWQFHAFHHSDDEVSASTSVRHHWAEEFFRYFVVYSPLLIIFGDLGGALHLIGVLVGVYGTFIHANLPLNWEILSRWVVTPQYHRLHHSLEPRHRDCNFAVFFPIWDRVFGTQQLPRGNEFPPTGLQDSSPESALYLLMRPILFSKK